MTQFVAYGWKLRTIASCAPVWGAADWLMLLP
jgi:hypothetical protein